MCGCRRGVVWLAEGWTHKPLCGAGYRWSQQRTGQIPSTSPGLPPICWPELGLGDSEGLWIKKPPNKQPKKFTYQDTCSFCLKNSNESNHRMSMNMNVFILREAAGHWHLCAPLDFAILKLLLSRDGPWGLLRNNFIPARNQTWS